MYRIVLLLLFMLAVPAMGGGQQKKKRIKGCDPSYPRASTAAEPSDHSSCQFQKCQTPCPDPKPDWFYHALNKVCLKSESQYCGVGNNSYPSCEECMRICATRICAEEASTTRPDVPYSWE
ncbi:uncharacterized protein LOC119373843 [Rhipicephalus sanguineus]|uniref:uncharacterized protein LOC119373843 n=1 Tax=Rhipicephalus sanguineus TaxID=34632 RepID=UPI001893B79C|nr:uncharacterized protein LOC119373843 [Rhipicephalus sanguineus]